MQHIRSLSVMLRVWIRTISPAASDTAPCSRGAGRRMRGTPALLPMWEVMSHFAPVQRWKQEKPRLGIFRVQKLGDHGTLKSPLSLHTRPPYPSDATGKVSSIAHVARASIGTSKCSTWNIMDLVVPVLLSVVSVHRLQPRPPQRHPRSSLTRIRARIVSERNFAGWAIPAPRQSEPGSRFRCPMIQG